MSGSKEVGEQRNKGTEKQPAFTSITHHTSRVSLDIPLVRAVLGLPDDGLSCVQCQAWLPSYVDAEIGDVASDPRYRPVKRHLLLCQDCADVYLELLDLADGEDRLPRPERYPEPDLSFLAEEEDRDE